MFTNKELGGKEKAESEMTVSFPVAMTGYRVVLFTKGENTIRRIGLPCGEKYELSFGQAEFEAIVQNMSGNIQKGVGSMILETRNEI